jgi:hypothetical protein
MCAESGLDMIRTGVCVSLGKLVPRDAPADRRHPELRVMKAYCADRLDDSCLRLHA